MPDTHTFLVSAVREVGRMHEQLVQLQAELAQARARIAQLEEDLANLKADEFKGL